MTKDITIINVVQEILERKINITSTIENKKKNLITENFLISPQKNEFEIKEHASFRVFDVTDIDWGKIEQDILLSLNWNDLKTGEINEMETIVRNLISMSSQKKTLEWLNDLYLEYNDNALFMCTLFHTLSHMEYEEVLPNGPTMAMASLNHKNDKVIGYAIKAFSNWNSKKTIKLMQTNIPRIPWANKEWNRVLEYITIHGDDNELLDENDWSSEGMDSRTTRSA